MNDQQFKQFIEKFNTVMEQQFATFKEEMRTEMTERFLDVEGKIDWLIGAVDTDENERLAIIVDNERNFADHERRIRKLELATE